MNEETNTLTAFSYLNDIRNELGHDLDCDMTEEQCKAVLAFINDEAALTSIGYTAEHEEAIKIARDFMTEYLSEF